MSELFSLADKIALITGASRGIGLAIAREYGRAGARVAISSGQNLIVDGGATIGDGN